MALRIRLRRPGAGPADTGRPHTEPDDAAPFTAELPDEAAAVPEEEYLVETEEPEARTPVLTLILGGAQAVMFGVVAVVSLAVFWTVGLMIGAF
jgi:hypothetical protein